MSFLSSLTIPFLYAHAHAYASAHVHPLIRIHPTTSLPLPPPSQLDTALKDTTGDGHQDKILELDENGKVIDRDGSGSDDAADADTADPGWESKQRRVSVHMPPKLEFYPEEVVASERDLLAERLPSTAELLSKMKACICRRPPDDDGDARNNDRDSEEEETPIDMNVDCRLHPDGLWVGLPPKVPKHQMQKMVRRLKREPGKGEEWFSPTGHLEQVADPVPPIFLRPVPESTSTVAQAKKYKTGGAARDLLGNLQLVAAEDASNFPDNDDAVTSLEMVSIDNAVRPWTDADGSGGAGVGSNVRVVEAPDHTYLLELCVGRLTFTSHPLFSEEHGLAAELHYLVEVCKQRKKKNEAQLFHDKLTALREARVHVNRRIEAGLPATTGLEARYEAEHQLKEQSEVYRKEIIKVRSKRNKIERLDFVCIQQILSRWDEIKKIRDDRSYQSTGVALVMYKKETDAAAEKEDLERNIEYHVAEDKEEHEREAAARKPAASSSSSSGGKKKTGKEKEEFGSFPEFDAEAAEARIRSILSNQRPPGYPILTPKLTSQDSDIDIGNPDEKSRRDMLKRFSVFVRVVVNGKEVQMTTLKELSSDFDISFDESFKLHLHQRPQEIRFDVYHSNSKTKITRSNTSKAVLLAELYVPVPENIQGLDAPKNNVQFSSNRSIGDEFNIEVPASALMDDDGSGKTTWVAAPVMNGLFSYTAGWGALQGRPALVPPVPLAQEAMENVAKMRARGEGAFRALEEALLVAENAPVDPNDPRNESLLSLKKTAALKKRLEAGGGVFRLWSNDPTDGDLVIPGVSDGPSKRFELLRLRTKEAAGYKSIQVPLREEDVPEELGKRLISGSAPVRVDALKSHVSEFRQNQHAKRLQELRAEQIVQQRKHHSSVVLLDVVDENPLPEAEEGFLSLFLKSLFAPARPLHPQRKAKATPVVVSDPKDCEVTVTIRRAWGLPARDTTSGRKLTDENTLRPYVQVVFQNSQQETSIGAGSAPAWNEDLVFPFVPYRNDFSPESLRQCTDKIYINIFDEMVRDIQNDPRLRGTEEHNRLERQFLGSVAVPFSTLLSNPQLDGTYRIRVPVVMLGYKAMYMPELVIDKEGDALHGNDAGFRSYLSVFITINPPLQILAKNIPIHDSTENELIILYNDRWQKECLAMFPNRDFNAITLDINSRAVFISKYILPQTPPNLPGSGDIKKQLARFVSMIPNTPDAVSFVGNCDLWTTSDQLFNMLSGDEEEHAILLCNYFLTLDAVDAYVVLGYAVPEGPTAYVMTREQRSDDGGGGLRGLLKLDQEDPSIQFWNAVTGDCYSGRDSFSPLKQIDCIFNNHNVWGNVQLSSNPINMMFDLANTSAWKAFFTSKREPPGGSPFSGPSVQVPSLEYSEISKPRAETVQSNITKALKQEIRLLRERKGHTTRFNGMVSDELRRKVLSHFEEAHYDSSKGFELSRVLETISEQQGLRGFPINFPYINMEDAVEQVISTYHFIEDIPGQGIQFGLGVHVAPYPNDVYSCWVYLVTINTLAD